MSALKTLEPIESVLEKAVVANSIPIDWPEAIRLLYEETILPAKENSHVIETGSRCWDVTNLKYLPDQDLLAVETWRGEFFVLFQYHSNRKQMEISGWTNRRIVGNAEAGFDEKAETTLETKRVLRLLHSVVDGPEKREEKTVEIHDGFHMQLYPTSEQIDLVRLLVEEMTLGSVNPFHFDSLSQYVLNLWKFKEGFILMRSGLKLSELEVTDHWERMKHASTHTIQV